MGFYIPFDSMNQQWTPTTHMIIILYIKYDQVF